MREEAAEHCRCHAPEDFVGSYVLRAETQGADNFLRPADRRWTPVTAEMSTLLSVASAAFTSRTFDGVTLSFDHTTSWGNIVSTTAWRGFDTVNREDEDGTNRPNLYFDTANVEHNTSFYQEFKFSGANDRMDWVAGLSYYDEDARQRSETTAARQKGPQIAAQELHAKILQHQSCEDALDRRNCGRPL